MAVAIKRIVSLRSALRKRNCNMFSTKSFKLKREKKIDELSLSVSEFEHTPTGALFYHLDHASSDTFSIAFRTLPPDSTGLPHILEHTALCGSQEFPVRDPFFKMLNRSLAVYMNAWTGADFTQYPFVTENSADYSNLRKVYLDAVFRPLLLKDDFLQEGWRVMMTSQGQAKNVQLGGIVYNEMKGALSDADAYFLTRFQQVRFGSNSVYGVVSGGDPLDIPKLNHNALVQFHRKFYQPSNSVTVSSGKTSIEDNLRALQVHFERFKCDKIDLSRLRALPVNLKNRVEITGPIDPMGDASNQNRLLISFLANDISDINESFSLKILCDLLFEGPAAPFYQALIDSGLGSEYAPGTGYDTSTTQATISVGLQGINEEKITLVESEIDRVFREVRMEPEKFISRDRVETVLHQVELGLRYASANFGLSLVSSVTQSWVHGIDPIAALGISNKVAHFRKLYDKGGLFESLLDRYIKQSSRLVFIMRPDKDHATKLEAHENSFVENLKLTDMDMAEIESNSKRLQLKQDEIQDLTCLPCLSIDQVNSEIRYPAIKPSTIQECALYEHKCPEANGLVYFKAALKINQLTNRQILLMPLLLQCLSELGGTKRNSAAEFDSAVKRFTGGLGFSLHQSHLKYPCLSADLSFLISSYSLNDNSSRMLELLIEALNECNLLGDQERIKMLIASSAAAMSTSIASSGNRFASLKAGSLFNSPRAQISERLNGLTQAQFINELLNESIEGVAHELVELKNILLSNCGNDAKAAVVHSSEDDLNLKGLVSNFFKDLKMEHDVTRTENKKIDNATGSLQCDQAVFVPGPFSSNFSALSFMPFPDSRPSVRDSAILNLTTKLLRSKYLHREIREKGGAYGSAASFSTLSGLFTFSSYRDPSPLNSLNVFREAGKALLSRDAPSEEDLLGAKLSTFSDMDAPVDISSRGFQEFLYGPVEGSDVLRQEYREAFRACSLKDIKNILEDVILPLTDKNDSGRICVIGEVNKIEDVRNDLNYQWKIIES